ncbi:hypothetical protein ACFYRY_42785 [Streptomyces sp. NPDC005263]|uniref:hypothetical protein n=1 Tax=Streptomyces sp. NPDC005263 TaxID=3364711 RepID=UPI00369FCDE3
MTSQAQRQSYTKEQPLALCDYEIVPANGASPHIQELDLDSTVAKVFGLGQTQDLAPTVNAAVKTWAFTGQLFTADHQPVGTLDNLTITAMKLNDPQTGRPLVVVNLDYLATSHGWRTGRGLNGEPYGMTNNVFFRNSAGGLVWSMYLSAFLLDCNMNRWHVTHGQADRYNVAWFDVAEAVAHEVGGTIFRC